MSSQYYEYFTFGTVKSCDYGVWISGEKSFFAPTRDVETVIVPGRNGTLTLDNGRWNNVEITYPCYMSGDFLSGYDAFKNAILTEMRTKAKTETGILLSDTYHPNVQRYARCTGGFKPKPGPYNKSAKFDVTFDADPRAFLITNAWTQYASGASISAPTGVYPTINPAHPLIRLEWTSGTGTVTFVLNGVSITVTSPTYRPFYIDCESQRAFYLTNGNPDRPTYYDDKLTLNDGAFPVLDSQANSFTYSASSDTMKIYINPRWWIL